jgi:hypothetical protein
VEASIQEKVTASISKEKRNLQSPKKAIWRMHDASRAKMQSCVVGQR